MLTRTKLNVAIAAFGWISGTYCQRSMAQTAASIVSEHAVSTNDTHVVLTPSDATPSITGMQDSAATAIKIPANEFPTLQAIETGWEARPGDSHKAIGNSVRGPGEAFSNAVLGTTNNALIRVTQDGLTATEKCEVTGSGGVKTFKTKVKIQVRRSASDSWEDCTTVYPTTPGHTPRCAVLMNINSSDPSASNDSCSIANVTTMNAYNFTGSAGKQGANPLTVAFNVGPNGRVETCGVPAVIRNYNSGAVIQDQYNLRGEITKLCDYVSTGT